MKKLLSGNEAIALGAHEAACGFAAAYPGTPSTEILETIAVQCPEITAEWAVNEKVALENAFGAAIAGLRSLVAMKHVGLNVAADPLMTISYTGVEAGLVIVSADDPNMYSSQNEQDNRHYARFAKIPMLEPADSQEAYELTRVAFELSEKFDTPVLLRISTRIAHTKTVVTPAEPVEVEAGFRLQPQPQKYVMIPAYARRRHVFVEERLKQLKEFSESFSYQRLEERKQPGIITSGIDYEYVREALPEASVLKLTMTYPLPEQLIRRFAERKEHLLVIESLDPFLEEQIKAAGITVEGKELTGLCGELNPDCIRAAVKSERPRPPFQIKEELPPRLPLMCAGCPYRGVFFVLKKLRCFVTGDIGCYTLGTLPPLEALHTCVCMGAGIGTASGIEVAKKHFAQQTPVFAIIGDSTFIHGGITPLLDAVYNKFPTKVIILDNQTTAMTGHQPHPGTGKTIRSEPTRQFDFECVARALGVEHVHVIDPYELAEVEAVLRAELEKETPSLIIARAPCIQLKGVTLQKGVLTFDREKCTLCKQCLQIGCPALVLTEQGLELDQVACLECGICAQLCKVGALAMENASPEPESL